MDFLGAIPVTTFLFMSVAALCAGLIDAIAGGGGLIQLPALLIGLPQSSTVQVLGTNKLSAIFGTSAAAVMYRKRAKPDLFLILSMAITAMFGSISGALLASYIPTRAMRPLVLVLLIAVGVFTWKRPVLGHVQSMRHGVRRGRQIAIALGGGIGFYDGIFGPGTGTFLMLVLVVVLGFEFLSASAISKIVNVATNAGAIFIFGIHGVVLWKIGALLGLANITGGAIGANLAIRGGSAFIRKIFLLVTALLIVKVGIDTISHW